jgi:hypothetical protein
MTPDLVIPVQGRQPAAVQAAADNPWDRKGISSPRCTLPAGYSPVLVLPVRTCSNPDSHAAIEKYIRAAQQHVDIPTFDEIFWTAADAAFSKATPEEQAAYLECYPDAKDGHDPSTWAEKLRVFWQLTGNSEDVHAKYALCQRYVEGLDMIKQGLASSVASKRMDLGPADRNDLDVLQQLAQTCFDALLQCTTYYLHNPPPPVGSRTIAAGCLLPRVGSTAHKYCNLHGHGSHSIAECVLLSRQPSRNSYRDPSAMNREEVPDRSVRFGSPPPQRGGRLNGAGAAVTDGIHAARPSCGTCGSTGHYDAKCWVTNPKEALKMYPEYSGPSDPQLHKVYVQACRRQGLVPHAYHLYTQPAAANIIHHRHRARRLPAAHDRHCADWYDALEYDNYWDAEQEDCMENYDYDNTCQLADSPSYSGGWMVQLPSCATSSGGGGESGFEEDLGDALWAAHVTCDQDHLTAADATSLSEGCNHPANLIATVATVAQLGATPEPAPGADSGIGMPSHVTESPHAAAAPPLLTRDPTGSNSYQLMRMTSPRCSETQHPFRNSFLSGLRTHSARHNQPANLGSLLPASAQHWVTIAQLLRVADHPHILRLLQSHESSYQPVPSHDASTIMGAAPESV